MPEAEVAGFVETTMHRRRSFENLKAESLHP